MTPQSSAHRDHDARKASARRTALIAAAVALAVYAGFILMNVAGQ